MSLVWWGRRWVILLLFFCCRAGSCPVPGRLLGCGRGPCPTFPDCPPAAAGQSYRWTLRVGPRIVGCTLLIVPAAPQQGSNVPLHP
jgi:hypothetical protein